MRAGLYRTAGDLMAAEFAPALATDPDFVALPDVKRDAVMGGMFVRLRDSGHIEYADGWSGRAGGYVLNLDNAGLYMADRYDESTAFWDAYFVGMEQLT